MLLQCSKKWPAGYSSGYPLNGVQSFKTMLVYGSYLAKFWNLCMLNWLELTMFFILLLSLIFCKLMFEHVWL